MNRLIVNNSRICRSLGMKISNIYSSSSGCSSGSNRNTIQTFTRSFAGVVNFNKKGDKVPINYTKDMKAPEILDDKAYPEWVFDLNKKLPSKEDLVDKFKLEGAEALNEFERKRLKKLIKKTLLHENNLLAEAKK